MVEPLTTLLGAVAGAIFTASTLATTGLLKKSQSDLRAITELTVGLNHIATELERFRSDMKVMLAEQRDYIQDSRKEVLILQHELATRVTNLETKVAIIEAATNKTPCS